jgi:hypothetical protein
MFFTKHFLPYLKHQLKICSILGSSPITIDTKLGTFKIIPSTRTHIRRFSISLLYNLLMISSLPQWNNRFRLDMRMLGGLILILFSFNNATRVAFFLSKRDYLAFANGLLKYEKESSYGNKKRKGNLKILCRHLKPIKIKNIST